MKTYVGIDPGAKGAMAVIGENYIHTCKFSEQRYKEILQELQGKDCVCCLENVNAMPGQGVTSMFNFGKNFGFIQGLLTAYSIPFELVRPQKWKKEYSITADKNTSIEVCKRLFPDVSLLPTERCKKDDDGIAESILMAEYARRKL